MEVLLTASAVAPRPTLNTETLTVLRAILSRLDEIAGKLK